MRIIMTHYRNCGKPGFSINGGLFVSVLTISSAVAISISLTAQPLEFGPSGSSERRISPDGSKVLYGVPARKGSNEPPQLWLEDRSTHQRTKLFDILRNLSAGWSPDGRAFYVNDNNGSDVEDAYLYNARTLERFNVGAYIQAADPEGRRFANGHVYYEVQRWLGPEEVLVRFFGHTDEAPVLDFDFRYRVSRNGEVKRLSERVKAVKD